MAGVDYKKLDELEAAYSQDVFNVSDGGLFVGVKILDAKGTLFRLIPAVHENMNGVYMFNEHGYWINGSRIVSPKSFGDVCPIEEEVKVALANDDDGSILKLIKSDNFQASATALFNVLQFDENENVVDDMVKMFNCDRKTLLTSINGVLRNPDYSAIFDRKKGYNLRFTKTPKKNRDGSKSATYAATPQPGSCKVSKKYFDKENVPDIVELTRSKMKTEEEMLDIISNYLYGHDKIKSTSKPIKKVKAKKSGKKRKLKKRKSENIGDTV